MKITVEHYGVTLTIEDAPDLDIHKLLEHFKTIAIGMGYYPSTFDEAITEYYENLKD